MKPALLFAPLALFAASPATAAPSDIDARVARVLKATPLIDGHNDWGETLVDAAGDARWTIDLNRLDPAKFDTDIARLRKGKVGGQFWSVYVSAGLPGPEQ
ncbi:membrane dipeptidase, partial [Sphingomonas sp. HMWF008]